MNFIIEDGGYKFTSTNEEMIDFIVRVDTENEIALSEIEEWIIQHTTRK